MSDQGVKQFRIEGYLSQVKSLLLHVRKKHQLFVNQLPKIQAGDLVHIHDSGFYSAYKFRRLPNRKVISIHSSPEPKYFKVLKDLAGTFRIIPFKEQPYRSTTLWIKKLTFLLISAFIPLSIKRFFLKKTTIVVLPSKVSQQELNLKNSTVIYQSIDTRRFHKKKKKKKELSIAYFGHLAASKGIFEVLKTFQQLNYDKNLYLTTVTQSFRELAKRTDSHIKVHGFVTDIVQAYNNTDIILAPFRHSGGAIATPLVLLEAMACERAIVTSDLPHLREICGDAVLYVTPGDTQALVKAIEKLAKNKKLREKLGKKARARVVKQYDQKDMFAAYDALYKELQ